jgi:hypothetical protein
MRDHTVKSPEFSEETVPVEFIICGENETWWTAIREVPVFIQQTMSNDAVVEYALEEHFNDMHGVVYVGVYNFRPEMPDYYNEEDE